MQSFITYYYHSVLSTAARNSCTSLRIPMAAVAAAGEEQEKASEKSLEEWPSPEEV